jgi:hypothetical protein
MIVTTPLTRRHYGIGHSVVAPLPFRDYRESPILATDKRDLETVKASRKAARKALGL